MVGKVEERVKVFLDRIKKKDGKIHAFLSLNPNVLKEARKLDGKRGKKGRLFGMVFALKANYCVKGLESNCASKTLEGMKATYDASIVEKIKVEDGLIIGMANMDEFACGVSGENSAFDVTNNPVVPGLIAGGSSSGSAAAVAADFCDVALGSDTGGSIRVPASFCELVGLRPSYGLISRYGLIDMAMSLDTVAPIGKSVEDVTLVLEVIKGKDEKDATSFDVGKIKLEKQKKVKIGVLRVKGVDKKIQELVDSKVKEVISKNGWQEKEVKIEHIDLAVQTYYPIVYVEVFSGSRKFDGRRFGKKIEDSCGEEVLRRIIGGSEIARAEFKGQYYKKALNVRKLITKEFEEIFKKVDCIVLPTAPVLPWKVGEGKNMKLEEIYAADALTTPASLAGIPAVSVPAGRIGGIPVGIQIICGKGEDGKMLSLAREFSI